MYQKQSAKNGIPVKICVPNNVFVFLFDLSAWRTDLFARQNQSFIDSSIRIKEYQ